MLVFSLDLKNEENPCGLVTQEEMYSNFKELRKSICNRKMKMAMGIDSEGNIKSIAFTDDFKETNIRNFNNCTYGCDEKIPFHDIAEKKIPQILKIVEKIIRKAEVSEMDKKKVEEQEVVETVLDRQAFLQDEVNSTEGKEMMKETDVQELAVQKEVDKEVSTVVDIEATSQDEVDVEPVVESYEENEVEQGQVELETEMEVVSTEQPAEEPLQKLIPPITVEPLPKTVEVIKTAEGSIFLQVMVDTASGIVEGCQYYRVDENGVPMLSTDTLIKVSKSRIEASSDYTILNGLRNFNLKITEDNIREAFFKTQNVIDNQSCRTATGGPGIADIYREMMEFAITGAKIEMQMKGIKTRHYNLTDDYIDIHTDWLEKVLANIEPIKKNRFLKGLCIIQNQMNTRIVISNRSKGYAYNTTGNVRVYRFTRNNALGNF